MRRNFEMDYRVSSRFMRVCKFLAGETVLNISTRKVGGLRFVKFGRLTVSFCISREYHPL